MKGLHNYDILAFEIVVRNASETRGKSFNDLRFALNYKAKIVTLQQIQPYLFVTGLASWVQDKNAYTSRPNLYGVIQKNGFNLLMNNAYASEIRIQSIIYNRTYILKIVCLTKTSTVTSTRPVSNHLPVQSRVVNIANSTPPPSKNLAQMHIDPTGRYRGNEKAIALIDVGVLASHPSLVGRIDSTPRQNIEYCFLPPGRESVEKCRNNFDPNPCYPLDVTATALAIASPTPRGVPPTPINLDAICSHGTWISGPVVGAVYGVPA
jgi:hypothetical protein